MVSFQLYSTVRGVAGTIKVGGGKTTRVTRAPVSFIYLLGIDDKFSDNKS